MNFADFSNSAQVPQYQGPPGGRPPGPAPQGMPYPPIPGGYPPGVMPYAPAPPEPPKTNYLLWGSVLAVVAGGLWWIGKQDEEFEKKQLAQNAVEATPEEEPGEPEEEDDT